MTDQVIVQTTRSRAARIAGVLERELVATRKRAHALEVEHPKLAADDRERIAVLESALTDISHGIRTTNEGNAR